jgi:uncharacterized metal-binding protein YceD (DUF177 family)
LHKKSGAWRDKPQFTCFAGRFRFFATVAGDIGFDSGVGGPYHARAMENTLRDSRAPSELAESGQVIEVREKITDFEHLAKIVEADLLALDPAKLPHNWRESVVEGELAFSISGAHEGRPVLNGQAAVVVDVVCQRCLEPFQLPLEAELRFLFANRGESDDEHGGYELWELAGETLRPIDLVEEALIMAMPFSAMHTDSAECKKQDAGTSGRTQTTMPFAELKAQLAGKK